MDWRSCSYTCWPGALYLLPKTVKVDEMVYTSIYYRIVSHSNVLQVQSTNTINSPVSVKVNGPSLVTALQTVVTVPVTTTCTGSSVPAGSHTSAVTMVDDEYLTCVYDIEQIKQDITTPHLGGLILEIAGLKDPPTNEVCCHA